MTNPISIAEGMTPSSLDGEILAARSTDDEASAILAELSKLQTLLTLQMRYGPVWIAAADLVQRTRILIIERCKR